MCYFHVLLLSDVISSIGPKISDADTYVNPLGWSYVKLDSVY